MPDHLSGLTIPAPIVVADHNTVYFKDSTGTTRMSLYFDATTTYLKLHGADGGERLALNATNTGCGILWEQTLPALFGLTNDGTTLSLTALPTSNPGVVDALYQASGTIKYCQTAGTAQVETATISETVEGVLVAGNATITVTSAGMTGSPKAISVAVATNDTSAQVATKVRTALAADSAVGGRFTVSGATDAVILTDKRIPHIANDATLNIASADDTCIGLVTTASSANTTAGVAPT